MPNCRDCHKRVDQTCTAHAEAVAMLQRPLHPPPLGACMVPIVESYLPKLQSDQQVLEIGCGAWDLIRSRCEEVGAHYEGIDVADEYFDKPAVATRFENLAELSFESDRFDWVIGNQSMEHWEEYGCRLEWGLYQCFRVLRLGGTLLLNVPIHFHGTRHFQLGQLERLRRLFARFSGKVEFEPWGRETAPLPVFHPYPGYRPLARRPAYVLDIHATKDRPLPRRPSNRLALTGVAAQLGYYPPSFNLYRLARKIGLAGGRPSSEG